MKIRKEVTIYSVARTLNGAKGDKNRLPGMEIGEIATELYITKSKNPHKNNLTAMVLKHSLVICTSSERVIQN